LSAHICLSAALEEAFLNFPLLLVVQLSMYLPIAAACAAVIVQVCNDTFRLVLSLLFEHSLDLCTTKIDALLNAGSLFVLQSHHRPSP
jgi:hypothetical protein